jgi:hypothetical protein
MAKKNYVKSARGEFSINSFINFNPFPHIRGSKKSNFFLYNFHDFFDGLIGYKFLKESGALIDANKNILTIGKTKIKMHSMVIRKHKREIGPNTTNYYELNLKVNQGSFMLPENIQIKNMHT